MAKQMQSAGLAGARVLGEKKVSSLLQFSWPPSDDRDEKLTAKNRQTSEDGKPLSGRGRRKAI